MNDCVTKLNSPDYLPPGAYRRNHEMYELICYVNCLIGCRMSGNSEGEGMFEKRIKEYMDGHQPSPEMEEYYNIVSSYVAEG